MDTQAAMPSPRQLALPTVLFQQRLLTQTCSVTLPVSAQDLAQAPYTLRATTISTLLEEILTQSGYRQDGLNE